MRKAIDFLIDVGGGVGVLFAALLLFLDTDRLRLGPTINAYLGLLWVGYKLGKRK